MKHGMPPKSSSGSSRDRSTIEIVDEESSEPGHKVVGAALSPNGHPIMRWVCLGDGSHLVPSHIPRKAAKMTAIRPGRIFRPKRRSPAVNATTIFVKVFVVKPSKMGKTA